MSELVVDLRSDTVTKPTAAMRRAIAEAEVGDDVFHDDPSVLALEGRVADLLGKDDAMYVPSGTMSNQAALRVHTQPGDIVLAPVNAHVHIHEMGAPYVLSGVTIQFLDGERGTFGPAEVSDAIPHRRRPCRPPCSSRSPCCGWRTPTTPPGGPCGRRICSPPSPPRRNDSASPPTWTGRDCGMPPSPPDDPKPSWPPGSTR